MKQTSLPYGNSNQTLKTNDNDEIVLISPKTRFDVDEELTIVKNALKSPCSTIDFEKLRNAKTIGIAINDQTRPVPHSILLPLLMNYIHSHCNNLYQVNFFIATGTHKPLQPAEYALTVPHEILNNYVVRCHDCDEKANLKFIGNTTKNTPVWINKEFMQCDLKIAVGDIEPHHFMGFSGGSKSIVIGLAGRETITANHKWLLNENSKSGLFDENPTRNDVEEMGDLVEIDLCLNTVLNPAKKIVAAFWGSARDVMINGVSLVRGMYNVRVQEKFDFVLASAGGYPKDINLYQSQKALTHACLLANPNAVVVLLAACQDGMGSDGFSTMLQTSPDMEAVIKMFSSMPFTLGPHKAYMLARQASQFEIYLMSDMDPALLKRHHIFSVQSIDSALNLMREKNNFAPLRIGVMPYATHTIPVYDPLQA